MTMLRGSDPTASARRAAMATAAVLALLVGCAPAAQDPSVAPPAADLRAELPELARQVEIRRDTFGVPHILADNLKAAAFALAYVQIEDHGEGVIRGIQSARGQLGLAEGRSGLESDFENRQRRARAAETFHLLREDTRDVYEGFAEGMNHFIRVYRDELPDWVRPDFTAHDVLARDVSWPSEAAMRRFRSRIEDRSDEFDGTGARLLVPDDADPLDPGRLVLVEAEDQDVGSNALALAPSRTTSGNAILLRNPHLSWSAGYYEAHVRVPGTLDFYGDFRIGGPFTVIGGFNPHLGFATTNNQTRTHEFYAFRADPERPDHILVDGGSVPLTREVVSAEFRDGAGLTTEAREFWRSPHGPVAHRADGRVYVYRDALDGEHRAGEQWLEMMKAGSLEEWKDAMRIGARRNSNFTYADRDGNIFYVWVSAAPLLPHPAGGDTIAVPVSRSDEVWTELAPFDSLPQLLNPPGGYLRNENDSPHFTNLNQVLEDDFSFWVEPPRLRFRSQHGHALLHNDRRFSLEDVVELKHSMRMVLADRVKDDLVAAVRASGPTGEVARAIELLAGWDNTVAADSRGGLLFETWWNRYRDLVRIDDGELFATEWSADEPVTTPRGLGDAERAVEAFTWAVPETRRVFGGWNLAWGEVHRVRRGGVDVPVGGCGGALGCYRVLSFREDEDRRRVVSGGDGWVLAVEFGQVPRAYSVLAYGQSPDPDSPYHANQAAMFAANEMKAVNWTEEAIARVTERRYRPGEERGRPSGSR